jgi:DNA-binding transcriptional MerR regulator
MAEPVTVDEQRMAVPRDVAARISRLSLRKVDYWARTRLVEPTVDTQGSTERVRLYGFLDLLTLVVAAELNARGVSVQHIRQVVGHLKARGYDRPLSELAFATVGNRVYFQHDDGTWEGGLRPDQLVLRELLDLEPLRQRIAAGARRDEALVGKVERRRGRWVTSRCSLALGCRSILSSVTWPLAAPLMTCWRRSPCSRPATWKRSVVRRSPDVAIRVRP